MRLRKPMREPLMTRISEFFNEHWVEIVAVVGVLFYLALIIVVSTYSIHNGDIVLYNTNGNVIETYDNISHIHVYEDSISFKTKDGKVIHWNGVYKLNRK